MTDFLPYPDAPHGGGKMFSYFIRSMHGQGHEVSLLSITRDADRGHENDLASECKSITTVPANRSFLRRTARVLLTTRMPPEYAFCESVRLGPALQQIFRSQTFDVVHAAQPSLTYSVLRSMASVYRPADRCRTKVVAHAVDVATKIAFRRLYMARGFNKLREKWNFALTAQYESLSYETADVILVHSGSDEMFVRSLLARQKLIVCVPVWFDAIDQIRASVSSFPRDNNDLLFVGNSADPRTRHAIDWLLANVFGAVLKAVPSCRLHIVSVKKEHARKWNISNRVICHPYTNNVIEFYDRCAAMVAPLWYGGGQHLKILNSFARGCPVVMTPVANDGIQARHNEEALIASNPSEFAAAIIEVLTSPATARRLAENALAKIRGMYPPGGVISALDAAYRSRPVEYL